MSATVLDKEETLEDEEEEAEGSQMTAAQPLQAKVRHVAVICVYIYFVTVK